MNTNNMYMKKSIFMSLFIVAIFFGASLNVHAADKADVTDLEGDTFAQAYAPVAFLAKNWTDSYLLWWVEEHSNRVTIEKSTTKTQYTIDAYGIKKTVVFNTTDNKKIAEEIAKVTGRDKAAVLKTINTLQSEARSDSKTKLHWLKLDMKDVSDEISQIPSHTTRKALHSELKEINILSKDVKKMLGETKYKTAKNYIYLLSEMLEEVEDKLD